MVHDLEVVQEVTLDRPNQTEADLEPLGADQHRLELTEVGQEHLKPIGVLQDHLGRIEVAADQLQGQTEVVQDLEAARVVQGEDLDHHLEALVALLLKRELLFLFI